MDDVLLLNGDAGSLDRHDALVVVPSRLGCPDHSFQGVAEVLEDQPLVLQSHGKHAIEPGGYLCRDTGFLLEDVTKATPPAVESW